MLDKVYGLAVLTSDCVTYSTVLSIQGEQQRGDFRGSPSSSVKHCTGREQACPDSVSLCVLVCQCPVAVGSFWFHVYS